MAARKDDQRSQVNTEGNEGKDDLKETGRLEAFSDGVFAVAITLLVLNIRTPDILLDDARLWHELLNQWPKLAAYVTSFATIGIMWLNHHRLFVHIKRINTVLVLLNLLLLLVIVFIPVPTALLADYVTRPDQHVAAIIYSSTCFLMACCFNVLWRYASYRHRLLGKNVDTRAVIAISRQYLFGPLVYLITFALSWVSTPGTIIASFVLALFFAVPGRPPRPLPAGNASTELGQD
jgi:uncharacterized membrane protein